MKTFQLALLLFSSTLVHSQSYNIGSLLAGMHKNGEIKGVVFDNETNNQPLLFANVAVKNSSLQLLLIQMVLFY